MLAGGRWPLWAPTPRRRRRTRFDTRPAPARAPESTVRSCPPRDPRSGMLPRRPLVLEVGERLVLVEDGRTGGDVGHLLPELLRQRLHDRRVGTLLPDADGDRLVGLGTGREVRVTEAGDLGHLGAPEGPPPSRYLLHLPGRRL